MSRTLYLRHDQSYPCFVCISDISRFALFTMINEWSESLKRMKSQVQWYVIYVLYISLQWLLLFSINKKTLSSDILIIKFHNINSNLLILFFLFNQLYFLNYYYCLYKQFQSLLVFFLFFFCLVKHQITELNLVWSKNNLHQFCCIYLLFHSNLLI